ncbi:regulatory LuxR family protein [Methylobacterium sp. B4]|nr:regulatory LuxR family protein [Methylobacterium sp. B4]
MRSRDQKKLAQQRCAEQLTRSFRAPFFFLFGMSGIINILALTGSFYMLQVYDRALPSGSLPTLIGLSILAIGLYLAQGLFDVLRSQILVRLGAQLDRRVAPLAQRVGIDMPRFGFSTAEAMERGRDVDTVRGFLGSPGLVALFDLPWVPVFLVFVYILHPYLGALTVAGAVVLALLTVLAELLTRRWTAATQQAVVARNAIADSNARSADVLKAMGFADRAVDRYRRANDEHLELQTRTTDVSGTFGAVSRVLRMILQSAVLGLGAYLVIGGELSAGAIIAASITSARALAPIDQAIGNWKVILAARTAFRRLKETVVLDPALPERTAPHRRLSSSVDEQVCSTLNEREKDILRLVAFGFTSKEIADRLAATPKTVETQKARACTKLGLASRAQIVQFAILQGWLYGEIPVR